MRFYLSLTKGITSPGVRQYVVTASSTGVEPRRPCSAATGELATCERTVASARYLCGDFEQRHTEEDLLLLPPDRDWALYANKSSTDS